MANFFEKVKNAGAYAADKTGDVMEIGVARGKIVSIKGDITDAEKKIGRYYYKKYLEDGDIAEKEVLEHFEKIDALNREIAELEAQIFAKKNEE